MDDAVQIMPAAICAALVKAQKAAKGVAKSGLAGKDAKDPNFRYRYASTEDIMVECREALASADLAVMPQGWTLEEGPGAARVVVRYMVIHAGGDVWLSELVSTPVVPGKGRPEDKAEAAALTYNLGYFLRGLLLLPRVAADEEVNARDDEDHVPAARAPKKIPFGPGAGKYLEEATPADLKAYRHSCERGLNDAKWGPRNRAALEAIDAELARRGGGEDRLAKSLDDRKRQDRDLVSELDKVQTDQELARWCDSWRDVVGNLKRKDEKSAVWAGVQKACSRSGVSEDQAAAWLRGEKERAA